ncbi:MAG: 1-(5-phosphoribosyl)-5-((5-phosphoribosylamino)methylideneamino)imidazole-4-carboxamide isomerase [Gammaproteobacteria bacterium]|nr:MAG: 1-(5-phosphoribosyl)-5-((5-phosphoribosylamino)methylideneamino)imidazole-4-carboxamide isomerase [Gammaproteobacteria bacterium]
MPTPTNLNYHKKTNCLDLSFDDGLNFTLSAEYLRVFSPSAEVRGHGPGQETLQYGKKYVKITEIRPVGNYAVILVFDDNHDSGIYSWSYLYDICQNRDKNWQTYKEQLKNTNKKRSND